MGQDRRVPENGSPWKFDGLEPDGLANKKGNARLRWKQRKSAKPAVINYRSMTPHLQRLAAVRWVMTMSTQAVARSARVFCFEGSRRARGLA